MTFARNLPIARKLALAFGIVCLLGAIQGIASLIGLTHLDKAREDLVNDAMPSIKAATSLQLQAVNVRRSDLSLAMCQTEECREIYKKKREKAILAAQEGISSYQALISLPGEREAFENFHQAFNSYLQSSEQAKNFIVSNNPQAASELLMRREVSDGNNRGLEELNKIVAMNFENGVKEGKLSTEESTQLRYTTSIAVLLSIGLAGLVGILLNKTISPPIRKATEALERFAAKDLTVTVDITSNDEIGRLSSALNSCVESIREILVSITHGAETLSSATQELSVRAQQTSGNVQGQTDKTNQIAAAAQEMTATIGEISQNSERAAEASRMSAQTASAGGNVMMEAGATMQRIAGATASASEKMHTLSQRSNEIGAIVTVIQEISEQTNLLALNAAIESARAGEHGKGFAVVANEVRRLAERTKSATEEIADTIHSIQAETRETLSLMEQGQTEVNAGIQETERANKSLAEIIESAKEVEHMIHLIATAATEQTAASGEISESATYISKLSSENQQASDETAEACTNLSGLANDLEQIVSQFRMTNNRADIHRATLQGKTASLSPAFRHA